MMVTTIQITDADSLMAVADMMEELGCFAMTAEELAAHAAENAATYGALAMIEDAAAAEIARHEAEADTEGDEPDDPFDGGPAALPARPRTLGERALTAALAYNHAHGIEIAFVPNASKLARRERRQRARVRIAA